MRVSTGDQSVELQRVAIKRYAEGREWQLAEIYEDVISGAVGRRPGLDRLMVNVRHHRLDAVIVWKFDRFSRSVEDLLASLMTFQAHGIDFVSVTEGIDTSVPAGKMVLTVLGAFAQFEHALIRERVIAGVREKRRQQGGRWGRRPTLPAQVVQHARQLLEQKQPLRTVAQALNVPRTTLRRALEARV
jgi:putative DNA-invertase from lambdoid prophage Rac